MNAVAEARATTNRVARTFSWACRLMPRNIRDDVYLLYLVFRTLDDLVDFERPEAADHIAAVEAWARGDAFTTIRETEVLDALGRRHPLPRDAFVDFCAGMRHDLDRARCEDEDDVDRYCYRVAGTVGVVMASVLGVRDLDEARPTASALGMAMQRTNILRDIDEDRRSGRVYLATETLARFGDSHEALLRHQIARADALYATGIAGLPLLRQGRRAVAAAAAMYREILREIERGGFAPTPRAVVPKRRKLAVALRAGALT